MVGSGNPPADFVQVIIGCVTAKAGLWHGELRLPVFFCPNSEDFVYIMEFLSIFSHIFTNCPLKDRKNWFIIARSIQKDA